MKEFYVYDVINKQKYCISLDKLPPVGAYLTARIYKTVGNLRVFKYYTRKEDIIDEFICEGMVIGYEINTIDIGYNPDDNGWKVETNIIINSDIKPKWWVK